MHSIEHINNLDSTAFITQFGNIYEHSPWVAERAWPARPFASASELHACMQRMVMEAGRAEQLALIRAHPELLGKLAIMNELTESSRKEQTSAGLFQCTKEEHAQMEILNRTYREKFGFPFIVAVRGLTCAKIIDRMAERLKNDTEQELQNCINEIGRIASFRLHDLIKTE